jgi:hypothetical protein
MCPKNSARKKTSRLSITGKGVAQMSNVKVPLWINLLSVAVGLLITYLMAKWQVWKANRDSSKGAAMPFRKEGPPPERPFKKAA